MIYFLAGTFPCMDSENVIAFQTFLAHETPFILNHMTPVPIVQQQKIKMPGQPGAMPCFMFWCSCEPGEFKTYFNMDSAIGNSLNLQKALSDKFAAWAIEYTTTNNKG